MDMHLNDYLQGRFRTLALVPSIYHQWDIGIHFTLGENIYPLKENGDMNLEGFQVIYQQIFDIFNDLFEQDDGLFLVTNIYKRTKEKATNKLKVFQPYVKDKDALYRIHVKTFPYPFELEEAEQFEMQQFSLYCKQSDLHLAGLLKGACNEDFPLQPRFGGYDTGYPDVFFVNITKDIIFFIYDDRGCEVIALDAERLRPLYEKYDDWIEDTDRSKMEQTFT